MTGPTDREAAARAELRARLAASREELRRLLDPPRQEPGAGGGSSSGSSPGGFPRSRTMRILMSERGLGILGAAATGLLIARPTLALRLLRMLPASAFAKALLTRAMTAMRSKRE